MHRWKNKDGIIITLADEPQIFGQFHTNQKKGWTYLGKETSTTKLTLKKSGKQLWNLCGAEVRERSIDWALDKRPRVVLVVDTHDWSFAETAKQIISHLSDRFQFAVVPMYSKPQHKGIECDIVYCLWHSAHKNIKEMYDAKAYIGNLTDHYSSFQEAIDTYDGWTCSNFMLFQELCEQVDPSKVKLVSVGVDSSRFVCSPGKAAAPTFKIGWTGNTNTISNIKGLPEIKEACKLADVELLVQDAATNPIQHDQMYDEFYSKISCYVCASELEGTPTPVLEALSCGIPVITTRVGITSQVIKHGVNGFFIPNREPATIAGAIEAITKLDTNTIQRTSRASIYPYSWDKQIKLLEDMFDSYIDNPIKRTKKVILKKSNKKYVSLLVPYYNGLRFIPELMKNLESQDLSNTKVYFYDDGSTDGSSYMVQSLAHNLGTEGKDYEFYTNESRQGIAATINLFIKEAKEPYILKQDVDDLCEPDRVSTLLSIILEKEVSAVFGNIEWFMGSDTEIRYPMDWMKTNKSEEFIKNEYLQTPCNCRVSFAQCLCDRNVFKDVIGFLDEQLKYGEDQEIIARFMYSGLPFALDTKPTYLYRKHIGSTTSGHAPISISKKEIWTRMPNYSRILHIPKRNVLLSSYFFGAPDPQDNNNQVEANDPSKIDNYYNSIEKHLDNIDLIIFHDGLSKEFMSLYPKIIFKYHELDFFSTNDERFLAYVEYLNNRKDYTDRVLMTDLFDVVFTKNPFDLISNEYKLYCGLDERENIISNNGWVMDKMKEAFNKVVYEDKQILNAGAIGGTIQPVLNLLNLMKDTFISLDSNKNINMAVYNKAVYDLFSDEEIHKGAPFTSRFKRFERHSTSRFKRYSKHSKAYIIHK